MRITFMLGSRLRDRLLIGIAFFLSVFMTLVPTVQAVTQNDLDSVIAGTPFYDPTGFCPSDTEGTDSSGANSATSQDINSIVSKYGLQSAIIISLADDKTVAEYHSDQPPNTPA